MEPFGVLGDSTDMQLVAVEGRKGDLTFRPRPEWIEHDRTNRLL
jgi:hypothetical protein